MRTGTPEGGAPSGSGIEMSPAAGTRLNRLQKHEKRRLSAAHDGFGQEPKQHSAVTIEPDRGCISVTCQSDVSETCLTIRAATIAPFQVVGSSPGTLGLVGEKRR